MDLSGGIQQAREVVAFLMAEGGMGNRRCSVSREVTADADKSGCAKALGDGEVIFLPSIATVKKDDGAHGFAVDEAQQILGLSLLTTFNSTTTKAKKPAASGC